MGPSLFALFNGTWAGPREFIDQLVEAYREAKHSQNTPDVHMVISFPSPQYYESRYSEAEDSLALYGYFELAPADSLYKMEES
jgi:hypothetical protein